MCCRRIYIRLALIKASDFFGVIDALVEKKSSLHQFRLKKLLDSLSSKKGSHTELISLYIPPDRQISDVMNSLRSEYSTASNIKSKTTRKNVLDAIEKVMQRLRLFKKVPHNGLVIFCGAIPQNGAGSEKVETYVVEPPDPISIYYYRCDQRFHLEPLMETLREKNTYGIVVIDGNDATIAKLKGKTLNIVKKMTSGIPGKHRAGGQSARRFERLREVEVNEYYKRVGKHINEIFLKIDDLKGILIGGPGPTKYDFIKGKYLQYTLEDKILSTVDTAYTGEGGLEAVLEKSPDILENVRYVEEKKLVQNFLFQLGHDTGLATYGEKEVLKALRRGSVKTLLIFEELQSNKATVQCSNCGFTEQVKIENKTIEAERFENFCSNCATLNLRVIEIRDIIDEMVELAEQTGAEVEIISAGTEEGAELKSFGKIAAILRYKQQ